MQNQRYESAVAALMKNISEEKLINVLRIIRRMTDSHTQGLIPATVQTKFSPENIKHGKKLSGSDMNMNIQTYNADDGSVFYALFLSQEDADKGGKDLSTVGFDIRDYIVSAFENERCDGVIINPFGSAMVLTKEYIEYILDASNFADMPKESFKPIPLTLNPEEINISLKSIFEKDESIRRVWQCGLDFDGDEGFLFIIDSDSDNIDRTFSSVFREAVKHTESAVDMIRFIGQKPDYATLIYDCKIK